jgi:hypothetical protein
MKNQYQTKPLESILWTKSFVTCHLKPNTSSLSDSFFYPFEVVEKLSFGQKKQLNRYKIRHFSHKAAFTLNTAFFFVQSLNNYSLETL